VGLDQGMETPKGKVQSIKMTPQKRENEVKQKRKKMEKYINYKIVLLTEN